MHTTECYFEILQVFFFSPPNYKDTAFPTLLLWRKELLWKRGCHYEIVVSDILLDKQ